MRGVFYACGLDYIADLHIVGTCHFAAFAVEAVFKGLVIEIRPFQPVTLAVGSCLFRSGIIRVDGSDRTIHSADGALDARLEIVVAYVLFL